MEISLGIVVTITIFLLTQVVGSVIWAVRLEGRLEAKREQIARLEKELTEARTILDVHRTNQDVHFNLRVSNQVDQSNERRFQTIETQLKEINSKLDKMADKK